MLTRVFGPFNLVEPVGTGGMGVVYRAIYRKNGRVTAVKLLATHLSENAKLVARFEQEMRILERLDHPNITKYYGGGKIKGQHFYAMKFMEGGTLAHLLERRGPLPWEQVVDFGIQICDALDYAHSNGIIHRDLKPANLFLGEDDGLGHEQLVLGDFGIARDLDGESITATGSTVGTYAYMAPEQINLKQAISSKTDLYALGCVMFEMLTGRTPFISEAPGDLMLQHLNEEPPSVRALAFDCPVWLEDIIQQLLAKNAQDRPYDAAHVKMTLEEVLTKVSAQVSVTSDRTSGGPKSTTVAELNPDLKKLLAPKKKKRKLPTGPLFERTWFQVCLLLLLALGAAWVVWPESEAVLFAKAQPLMESDDPVQWREAIDKYLQPLVKRFPNGTHAAVANEFIEKTEVQRLKRRLISNARLNRNPSNEPERLFMDAWHFEQFGDRITALEKYRSMIELLKDTAEQRDFVQLAKAQISEIEAASGEKLDRVAFVNTSLGKAEELYGKGRLLDARKIWESVETLYAANQELELQVRFARARMKGEPVDEIGYSPTKALELEPTDR
jgi:serine/threonine-protein kinase